MKTREVPEDYPTVEKEREEALQQIEEEKEEGEEEPGGGPQHLSPIQLVVQRQYREAGADKGPPESENELIEVQDFWVQPAEVSYGKGFTLSLGNYEMARIDVKITVPCYREEVDGAYEFAKRRVNERLREEIDEARNVAKNKGATHLF